MCLFRLAGSLLFWRSYSLHPRILLLHTINLLLQVVSYILQQEVSFFMARLTGYGLVRTLASGFLLDKKTVDSILSTVWGK